MTRPLAKILAAFAAIAALLLIAALLTTLRAPAPVSGPLPNPNGFDDFVKAGQMLEPGDYSKLSTEELRTTLAKDAEALRLVSMGLDRECRVPLGYSLTNAMLRYVYTQFAALAQALVAEGKLAELANRPGDAARPYLATIRLGQEIVRGGVVIDSLMGSSIEETGLGPLEKLFLKLDAKQCRELAAALETADSKREPPEAILHQEKIWERRTFGWKGQLQVLMDFKSRHRVGHTKTTQTRTRQLMIDLATRAYELEHGSRPKSLAELVPVYLKIAPRDPFTGKTMPLAP